MDSDNNNIIIKVRDLNVHLQDHHVLQNISFDIEAGEIVSLIGPNGSGKTTLVKTLLGLIPYSGLVEVLGGPPGKPNGHIGYVPQRIDFDRTIPLTVQDLHALFSERAERRKAHYIECLDRVKASHLLDRQLGDLSGGEFQRVVMGLALHRDPQLLILDEPAAGVDMEGEILFYQMLGELKMKEKITVILVSHDIGVVYKHATQVLCINHSLMCNGVPQEVLTPERLEKLYGQGTIYHHSEHLPVNK